ncbi:MAG: hypothetical protein Q4F84_08105, partial [Fibrobacter sp.]|nr:hypothetical protein [Fibrobacter sp.]
MIGKKRFISFSAIVSSAVLFCLALSGEIFAGVGESAVITLIFPPGARATGSGEAFTGVSDDISATYYNPAGLGQSPQANTWKAYLTKEGHTFTAIASKAQKNFAGKSRIWVGTESGLMRFNGKAWETYESHLIEENADLDQIVSRYLKVDDSALKESARWKIKEANGIGMKRFSLLKSSMAKALKKNKVENADSIADHYAKQLIDLASFERSAGKIFTIIIDVIKDSAQTNELADTLYSHFSVEDVDFSDKTELKIPFSIAVSDTITSLAIDESERLWVGTKNGLWRYDESEWLFYTTNEGLPSNEITTIA